MLRLPALAALLAVPALAAAQAPKLAPLRPALPRTHTPQPTGPAITAADLTTRLYIFADDSMQGRAFQTPGNFKGTEYIAAEVKKMGLQPAGDNGTYFQTVWAGGLDSKAPLDPKSSMTVDGTALPLHTDFLPLWPGELRHRSLAVVYAGPVGGQPTLTPREAAGKLVVFSLPAEARKTPEASLRDLPTVDSAAAIAIVALDVATPAVQAALELSTQFLQDPSGKQAPPKFVLLSDSAARKMFGKPFDALAAGATGKPVVLDYYYAGPPPSRNVVAVIPGSDPVLRHQYIALGAHNDHLRMNAAAAANRDSLHVINHYRLQRGADGGSGTLTPAQRDTVSAELARLFKSNGGANAAARDSIFNGADDDGSGSVSLLEIAEQIAAMPVKPKRSILFVWHTGEEAGLVGSRFFVDHPTVPLDSIVTQLNIDMVGRGDACDLEGGGPDYVALVGSRRLSSELGNLAESVNKSGGHNMRFDYSLESLYERSDHYSYASHGIPIIFFTTGLHSDYHQVSDEPQYIDYEHMARVDSLISDIAVHVANLDHRPVIDNPAGTPR